MARCFLEYKTRYKWGWTEKREGGSKKPRDFPPLNYSSQKYPLSAFFFLKSSRDQSDTFFLYLFFKRKKDFTYACRATLAGSPSNAAKERSQRWVCLEGLKLEMGQGAIC